MKSKEICESDSVMIELCKELPRLYINDSWKDLLEIDPTNPEHFADIKNVDFGPEATQFIAQNDLKKD